METPNEARERIRETTENPWWDEDVQPATVIWYVFAMLVEISNKLDSLAPSPPPPAAPSDASSSGPASS